MLVSNLLAFLRSKRALKAGLVGVSLILVLVVVVNLLKFAQLFGKLGEHAGIRTTMAEILEAHPDDQTTPDPRTPVIPKIIHQIYHNWGDPEDDTLREDWARARQSCIDLNPDWEIKLWTAKSSRDFVEQEFPWFLETYDSYKWPIQRVDSLRYFFIRHFGGIYQDLDNGCQRSLDATTYMPAFTMDGDQGALSNNIMGGAPQHPLYVIITETLPSWNWDYYYPYPTIMYGSGQWMFTAMWERYHWLLRSDGTVSGYESLGNNFAPLNRIISDIRPGADPNLFWTQEAGATWGQWDNWIWHYAGQNWLLLVAAGIGLVILSIASCAGCAALVRWRQRKSQLKGYEEVPMRDMA